MDQENQKKSGSRIKRNVLTPLKSTVKRGIEQIGEKVGEKIEETRARNRAIREVRKKIKQKELEQRALPIARKYGISLEEAVLYIQSEDRRKKAQEARKRLTEQLSEMNKNLSTVTATALQQPTTKKKRRTQQQKVDIYYEPEVYEPYGAESLPQHGQPFLRQEELFFEEEPFVGGEPFEEEPLFPPEPQRRSFPSYSSPSYSRVGATTYRRRVPQSQKPRTRQTKQKIDSMVNQIVIGRKKSPSSPSVATGKSTKKRVDEMLKKLI
ncbi:hypothetical protein DRN76_04775 [Methanosarcinales archaeon]|nr:MAG: hypothetical protein DRN76_04775 [Methanosarcinales archaeon]